MRNPPQPLALRQARRHLLEYGECPVEGIDARVARSWHRSLAAGLLPGASTLETEHATSAELKRILASQHELLAYSRPVMELLYQQVQSSQGMVILADAQGTLMHTLGRADFLQRAQQVALSNGASWHERYRGTNAIGTALAEGCAIEIHGGEHFLERNAFLTCTAAPIVSGSGKLLGVLDISGDCRGDHPHLDGLVNISARLIENRLLQATGGQQLCLHLHPLREGVGSVAEGLLQLTHDGQVAGANRAALAMLDLTLPSLGQIHIEALLDTALEALLQLQRQPGQPLAVRRHDGRVLYAMLQTSPVSRRHCEGHAPSMPTALADKASLAERAGAQTDALAQLDTGDLRWRNAADKARRVADKPIPLLIQGESGVGKELFARAVHDSGPRRAKSFVAINCAAVPENLIEAELFGYVGGAFTGARREGSPGRLRQAHGGTLFLDEIGDMPLALQARLLRVLQERQVSPLGGGAPVEVDFALICASHRNLREATEQARFRSDLYYRINGLTVHLPPLRERTDFAVLTQRLLLDLAPQRSLCVDPELLQRLRQLPWPGNLRQFANALRTAVAMLEPGEVAIEWRHLSDDLQEDLAAHARAAQTVCTDATLATHGLGAEHNLRALSRSAIRQALQSSDGNVSQAARQLGISRQTLYRKLAA